MENKNKFTGKLDFLSSTDIAFFFNKNGLRLNEQSDEVCIVCENANLSVLCFTGGSIDINIKSDSGILIPILRQQKFLSLEQLIMFCYTNDAISHSFKIF